MAYESLKAALDAKIYPNGNEEVTASMINSVIADCISQLGNFECGGEITPTTLFDFNAELKWWFIAVEPGIYTNFDGIIIDDEVAIILYEDAVFTKIELINKQITNVADDTTEIGKSLLTNDFVFDIEKSVIYQLLEDAATTDTLSDLTKQVVADGLKLDGIEEGAQVNVNADWDATTGDSVILNKPTDVTDLSTHASSELSDGDDLVKGPASATVGYIAVADDTSGKSIKYVPVAVDDSGNVVISGNATINGTLTTINSETLQVKDKNIEIAKVETPTDDTADGGGITLLGATNKTITWVKSKLSWVFNQAVEIAGNLNVIGIIKTNGSQISTNDLADGSNLVKNAGTSTDNAIARFDGVTGKVVQNSGAYIDDSGNIAGLKDTSTETVTIDSAVQMSYDSVNETLEFNFI